MNKKYFIAILLLAGLYFLTRLTYLTKLPIFTDEAIYIRWSQIALQDQAQRFISLEDGKQPLFIWLMLPFLKYIPDPLLAGRLISVIAGSITLAVLIFLTNKLFGKKVSLICGLLYIISPFFLQYDRLALYDSLTSALIITALFLSYLLALFPRLDWALLLGLTVGAGLLTKSSTQFSLILTPAALLLFNWKKPFSIRLLKWICFISTASILALLFQTLLRLSPLNHMVKLKNYQFLVSFSEFFSHPFARFLGNLSGLYHWTSIYFTWPYIFLLLIGIVFGFRKHPRKILMLLIWWAIPFFALAAFAKILYPRFVLFMLLPLLPITALGLNEMVNFLINKIKIVHSRFVYLFICLFVSYPIYFSSQIIFNPLNAPLPTVDRNQLLDDWPSGYGVQEIIEILKQKSLDQTIFVGTEGTFGLTPSAFLIYLKDNPSIQLKGYWPISSGIPELIDIANTGKSTYVIFKDTQKPEPIWPLIKVAEFRKGSGNVFMSLYQVLPKK